MSVRLSVRLSDGLNIENGKCDMGKLYIDRSINVPRRFLKKNGIRPTTRPDAIVRKPDTIGKTPAKNRLFFEVFVKVKGVNGRISTRYFNAR